jgi:hypothetical protein
MSSEEPPPANSSSPELDALTAVVRALEPLTSEKRLRVVESALTLLGTKPAPASGPPLTSPPANRGPEVTRHSPTASDIRSLKEEKKPKSANEMAALVAYYLTEVLSDSEKKNAVDVGDMEKYFKQANFRIPTNPKMILVNAKNAGYFDGVGSGRYKLNPVGYNLVAHSLPREASAERVQGPRRTRKRAAAKHARSAQRTKTRRS